MSINLNVTLDTSTDPWSLSVDQTDKVTPVPRDAKTQVISWQLTGNAVAGRFVGLAEKEPGFEWLPVEPPPGIFSDTHIGDDGKLTIKDLNNSARTVGQWFYILRATIGGTVYSTRVPMPVVTTKNPSIKNN